MRRHAGLELLALIPFCGCSTGGDYREISFSSDLTPGDIAHYRQKSPGTMEDSTIGFPFVFLPLLLESRDSEGTVAPDNDEHHFHFEETGAILLFLVSAHSMANFDGRGRNLAWERSRGFLFHLISSSVGQRRLEDGSYRDTSSFSLLWGLFSTARTARGRSGTLFWFPIVGGREDEARPVPATAPAPAATPAAG